MLFIKKIKFNNFRCFKFKEIEFKTGINVLVGDNGVGKTSVVEGISYFCLGKSFKSAKDKQVLYTNESFFNIIISSNTEKEEKTVITIDLGTRSAEALDAYFEDMGMQWLKKQEFKKDDQNFTVSILSDIVVSKAQGTLFVITEP